MRTRAFVHSLFVAESNWLGILNFSNAEDEWERHSVEDHEVRDGNGV